MEIFWTRLALYTVLPVVLGLATVRFDSTVSSRRRVTEAMLIPLFIIGVAGAGIGGAIAHLFYADTIADLIGWPEGSPFQKEVGFANLAIGVLGAVAASRRDGFREATVIAVTIFSVGATIVHVADIIETGNTAPGNTLQNLSNLARPALLIPLLVASRRAETSSEETGPEFDEWRRPIITASVTCVIVVATAFALGFALEQTALMSLAGALIGSLLFARALRSSHRGQPGQVT